jgi:hypothetical protein
MLSLTHVRSIRNHRAGLRYRKKSARECGHRRARFAVASTGLPPLKIRGPSGRARVQASRAFGYRAGGCPCGARTHREGFRRGSMCASTDAASSWVCLLVSLLGVFMPTPARCLMRGLVIGAGEAGGVSFFPMVFASQVPRYLTVVISRTISIGTMLTYAQEQAQRHVNAMV